MNVSSLPLKTNITVIAYKRPASLLTTLQVLSTNHGVKKYPLSIYIDGPKENSTDEKEKEKIAATEEVAKNFVWHNEKKVVASKKNLGLRNGVRVAIDSSLQHYESTIIVEDDIVTSPYFIQFMEDGLKKYQDHDEIGAICGHCYNFSRSYFNPTQPYFLNHFACWGWATWRRAWDKVCWDTGTLIRRLDNARNKRALDLGGDFISGILIANHAGRLDTWAALTAASLCLNGQVCLYPPETLTNNIGWRAEQAKDNTHSYSLMNTDAPMAYTAFSVPDNTAVCSSKRAWNAYSKHIYPLRKKHRIYRQKCISKITQHIPILSFVMKRPAIHKYYKRVKFMFLKYIVRKPVSK